tara:strand:+ start:681 stop:962 length:282 start_codon:yes stop_codon:yes gene_type:complete
MATELNENLGFRISIKTLGGIGVAMATVISMWFMLQADIAEARELPVHTNDVSRMEFDMKDKNIRLSIENTEKAVDDLKDRLIRMEDKLDALR